MQHEAEVMRAQMISVSLLTFFEVLQAWEWTSYGLVSISLDCSNVSR